MDNETERKPAEPIPVILLEPDQWRFRGMETCLENAGNIHVIGEHDYARILTMETSPDDLEPRASVIAQRLLVDFGVSVIPHVRDLFPGCAVLIHGDHESLESTASILAAGGAGFFSLSSPAQYLARAVVLITEGKLWGPREAVALMASHVIAAQQGVAAEAKESLPDEDTALLRYLHEGLANKEIATRLDIAEVTVKARLGRLYKRLGVNTRLQLLSTAIKQGLIPANGD
ncbi:MAG TPA: response regulator transcription factor [Thermoanaerobaculia bacterium]